VRARVWAHNVSKENTRRIDDLLDRYRLKDGLGQTGLRLSAMACVALPTCGLAMAEPERYLPSLLDKLDAIMCKVGLDRDPIVIRLMDTSSDQE
jgi:sulfite reductase (NADPH) hemoprotein beta-component